MTYTGTPWACENCRKVCNVIVGRTCCSQPVPTFKVVPGWHEVAPAIWERKEAA